MQLTKTDFAKPYHSTYGFPPRLALILGAVFLFFVAYIVFSVWLSLKREHDFSKKKYPAKAKSKQNRATAEEIELLG